MTKTPKIQLLYCPKCPILEDTRQILYQALEIVGQDSVDFSEINNTRPDCPAEFKNWPSPSILINGEDIEGLIPDPDQPCRLFEGDRNAPELANLIEIIKRAQNRNTI